ncbi:hypothetical protein QUB29_16260 [Microcoleus sp. B4b_D2]|uniref:hypothetical protein n=1 Tax=Microcoleus sp. B4b_D2 TaxID=3055310 RepID=UPI002FD581E0
MQEDFSYETGVFNPRRAGAQDENSIALGGIRAIRSHLGALGQFDRTSCTILRNRLFGLFHKE